MDTVDKSWNIDQINLAERVIGSASVLYDTSARLHTSGMIADANSVAKKARVLLDLSLTKLGIDPVTE